MKDDGRVWGHIEDGKFRPLHKPLMIDAGYGPPPFEITLPGGQVRNIVHQPEDKA